MSSDKENTSVWHHGVHEWHVSEGVVTDAARVPDKQAPSTQYRAGLKTSCYCTSSRLYMQQWIQNYYYFFIIIRLCTSLMYNKFTSSGLSVYCHRYWAHGCSGSWTWESVSHTLYAERNSSADLFLFSWFFTLDSCCKGIRSNIRHDHHNENCFPFKNTGSQPWEEKWHIQTLCQVLPPQSLTVDTTTNLKVMAM